MAEDRFFVAGLPENFSHMNLKPFDKETITIDATLKQNGPFFDALTRLDFLAHQGTHLTADKWVMLDCGLIPSAYVGFGRPVEVLNDKMREDFKLPDDYEGLVPISEYCAIPRVREGQWMGHTLATVEKGLGLQTKVLGMVVFGIEHYTGVAQYTNSAVRTHTKIADLELVAAITSAHDFPTKTFIYQHAVDVQILAGLHAGIPREQTDYDFLLDPQDYSSLVELQKRIEEGERFAITSPGQYWDTHELRVPFKNVT